MKALRLLIAVLVASVRAEPLIRTETIGITLFQTFFDNLTENFINPLINTLTERPPSTLFMNQYLGMVDFINVTFNVTDVVFPESHLNPVGPIVVLGDNSARFQINELTMMLEFDYMYISDPPLLADIGTAYLGVQGMTLEFNWTSTLDETFEIYMTDLELSFLPDQPHPLFDGISDFSVLSSGILTTITAVIRNRLVSFFDSQLMTPFINKTLNKII